MTRGISFKPSRSWRLDGGLLAAGAGLGGISLLIPVRNRPVPTAGFDRALIHLGLDRRIVGNQSGSANRASDWALVASSAYPFALASLSASPGMGLQAPLARLLPYLEATAINEGLTSMLKRGVSRPRPYLYLPGATPDRGDSEVGFESFPSGHSSQAWCSASFAVVDHLFSRPEASWRENAAVGLVGGLLAAGTGYLRVRAGQHFPTDVIAGAVLGTCSGAMVPLAHHYFSPDGSRARPARGAWLQSLAGAGAGVLLVVFTGPMLGPG